MDTVECHSGFAYAERPVALTWQGKRQQVAVILDEGRTPGGRFFRVRTVEGQLFRLEYDEANDAWQIQPI